MTSEQINTYLGIIVSIIVILSAIAPIFYLILKGKIMEETKHLIEESIEAFDKANENVRTERSKTYELKIETINRSIKELGDKHKESSDTIIVCLNSIKSDIQENNERLHDCETEIKLLKKA
jgi:predicted PurR-regulated permease PerM